MMPERRKLSRSVAEDIRGAQAVLSIVWAPGLAYSITRTARHQGWRQTVRSRTEAYTMYFLIRKLRTERGKRLGV